MKLTQIPQKRALLYLLLLSILPSFFVLFILWGRLDDLSLLSNQLLFLREKNSLFIARQERNSQLIRHYQEADHFYIDKTLETLSFLDPEIQDLQKIVRQKNFPDDEVLKKRLEFLTGENNDLVFSEGVVQNYGTFQETVETQVRPVQVNVEDLKKILALIEGPTLFGDKASKNRPQLIITEFKLDKKTIRPENDVFVVNMKLIKREFTPK